MSSARETVVPATTVPLSNRRSAEVALVCPDAKPTCGVAVGAPKAPGLTNGSTTPNADTPPAAGDTHRPEAGVATALWPFAVAAGSGMYDSILLPVDGSDHAAKTVDHAARLADWAGATIQVVFVADTTQDSVTVVDGTVVDALERDGGSIVAAAAERLESLGVDHGTDIVQGSPAPTIVDYAERYGYDLVVLPTHGRTGISRYLLGSVTEKVVRLSDVPVLTARMSSDEMLTFPYGAILLPTDGSPAALAAARHGLSLAAALDATVHVLSVVDDRSLGPDARSALSADELERPAAEAVDELVAEADAYDLSRITTHVERGPPAEVIKDRIETCDIHAVVMGSSGRRGVDRILLGSVAEKTVRSAPVPVITVHDRS